MKRGSRTFYLLRRLETVDIWALSAVYRYKFGMSLVFKRIMQKSEHYEVKTRDNRENRERSFQVYNVHSQKYCKQMMLEKKLQETKV